MDEQTTSTSQKKTSGKSRRILQHTNLAVYTVIGIAIIVLANWFASQHVERWDLTKNKLFSLSPQTLKILKNLKQNVTIYAFDRKDNFRSEADVLNEYSTASRRVQLKYVDVNQDPGLARQFGIRSYGTIVVDVGDRHFQAQSNNEQGITNALIRTLKQQSVVYFIQGHGEGDPAGVDPDGYSNFEKALQDENDEVKTLVLAQTLQIPADASVVVIAGPQHDYLPQEVDVLHKYLDGGGRLLMMLDAGIEFPNLAKLISDYNVTVQNDLVLDQNPIAQLFGTGPETPLITKYGTSPITQPLERTLTAFPLTRSFQVGSSYKSGVTVDSLCETTPQSFGVPNWNPSMRSVRPDPNKDLKGPLTVAVAVQVSGAGDNKADGRFVALGTSQIARNRALPFQGDRDLMMNSLDWLTANEDMISVRPKLQESQHLNLTAQQMSAILLRLAAVPIVIIAAGIIVWWGRR